MTGPMFFSSYLGLRANVSFRTFCLDTNDFFFFFFAISDIIRTGVIRHKQVFSASILSVVSGQE